MRRCVNLVAASTESGGSLTSEFIADVSKKTVANFQESLISVQQVFGAVFMMAAPHELCLCILYGCGGTVKDIC